MVHIPSLVSLDPTFEDRALAEESTLLPAVAASALKKILLLIGILNAVFDWFIFKT
ncbi:hypothetical protein [Burkholderia gladioli]|uniref:hypothetical protein n=1 Tax=Burkholderia gladioli TaxID=28095 RepID=UPI001640E49A|nr:hypothetical protein [Burkholderia gladioli]